MSAICQVCNRKYTIGKLGSSYCKECKKALKRGNLTIIEKKEAPLPVGQPVTETVTIQQTQVQGQPVFNVPNPNQFPSYPAQYQQYPQYQQQPTPAYPTQHVMMQQTNNMQYNPTQQYSGYPPTYH